MIRWDGKSKTRSVARSKSLIDVSSLIDEHQYQDDLLTHVSPLSVRPF